MFQVEDINIGGMKLAGRSRAKVVDVADPQKRGRIKVNHPLLGETVWIPYLKTPGFFDPPRVDDLVYVECDAGFASHPIAWGGFVRGEDADPDLPECFKQDIPQNRGFYTPGFDYEKDSIGKFGHLLEFDDGLFPTLTSPGVPGTKRGVRLTTSGGKKFHLSDDGTLPTDGPNLAGENSILLEDEFENGFKILQDLLVPTGFSDSFTFKSRGKFELLANSSTVLLIDGSPLVDALSLTATKGTKVNVDGLLDTITIAATAGATVSVDGTADLVTIKSAFGDQIEVSALGGIQGSTPAAGGTSFSFNSGNVEIANSQASMSMSVTGDIEIKNSTSSLVLTAAGQVELKGAAAGVVDLLVQTLQALATDTYAGFGAPAANIATYADLLIKANLLKAS